MGEFKDLTDEETKAFFRDKASEGNPTILLMSVLAGLSEIYKHENSVRKRDENETLQEFYARVKKVRRSKIKPLMDGIDTVMKSLASDTTELKGGRYVSSDNRMDPQIDIKMTLL